ncbi:hypothetical protein, partial [Sphingobium cupriresistens]|uniref:hypothetical protein n=1 Tax=Sphingobium cupriresistens TaxID=1132417 RepID=UPI001F5D2285
FHAVDPHTSLTRQKGFKVDDFYAARSRTIPPLPWSNIAPPFSPTGVALILPPLLHRLVAIARRSLETRYDLPRFALFRDRINTQTDLTA